MNIFENNYCSIIILFDTFEAQEGHERGRYCFSLLDVSIPNPGCAFWKRGEWIPRAL